MIKYTFSAIVLATLVGGINLNAAEEGLPAGVTMKECAISVKPGGSYQKFCYDSGKLPADKLKDKKEICYVKVMPDGAEAAECKEVK